MKKLFFLMAAALMSLTMTAGGNDLLWDYTEGAPASSPDNGLYFNNKVNDAAGTNNGLKGIKLNSSGYCCFTKAPVAGKLKLSFGPRSGSNATCVEVWNWSGDESAQTKGETKYGKTGDQSEYGTQIFELTAEQNNIYLCRGANVETALQKIEFIENVPRDFVDFKIEFRENPYKVTVANCALPEGCSLPDGVKVSDFTYNGNQHGVYGGKISVAVDGPVKFTFGACQYSGSPIEVNKDGQPFASISNIAPCGETTGNYNQFVTWVYTGEAATLEFVFAGNTYLPYFFAEATEITPCQIIFKDYEGTELGRVDTYEGATLEEIPYKEEDMPLYPDAMAFRGWFYSNNKKANVGDVINGNTTIQAKVTPIEYATVGSVQTYNFADPTFYPEDHETVDVHAGEFHDAQHGWYFSDGGSINVQVAGNAVISITLCTHSESDYVTVYKCDDNQTYVDSYNVRKNETPDGTEFIVQYAGEPMNLLIRVPMQYIHKVVVYNVLDFLEKDAATGYYIVPAGDVASFRLALIQAQEGDKIFLPRGTYDLGETVLTSISKNNISIIGESMDKTIIKNAPDYRKESIDQTATIRINKNVEGTYLQDLTIQNALDYYKNDNGRAVALWDQGTKTVCKNVKLLSCQDTYYSNLQGAVKYFEDCDIRGTVDFICGDGSVYFKNNLLFCEKRKAAGGGSDCITANNGVATDRGYVFESCVIASECPVVSLGRAWNNSPKVTYLNTQVSYDSGEFSFENSDIQRWTKKLMNPNAWPAFGEYNTQKMETGTILTPASNLVTFVDEKSGNATQEKETVLSAEQAAAYTMEYTLGEWAPTAKAEAEQLRMNVSFEDGILSWNPTEVGIYLVYIHSVPYCITTETSIDLNTIDLNEIYDLYEIYYGSRDIPLTADYYVRFANARGGFGPEIRYWDNPEAIDNTEVSNNEVKKAFRNGQVVILRGGHEFNLLGTELK